MITETICVLAFKKNKIELAIDSDCPLSSASLPGKAPAVSTNVIIGKLNFSAKETNLGLFYILLVLPYQSYA